MAAILSQPQCVKGFNLLNDQKVPDTELVDSQNSSFNSLAPESPWALLVKFLSDECHRTSLNSTLVQVMAWCQQATSHYLSQWWPRFMLAYGASHNEFPVVLQQSVHSIDAIIFWKEHLFRIIHSVCALLYFVVLWCRSIISASFKVTSLALGQ